MYVTIMKLNKNTKFKIDIKRKVIILSGRGKDSLPPVAKFLEKIE